MSGQNVFFSDVLVLGSGFAGLRAASAAARMGASVTIVEKGPRATPDILGFNVAVEKDDSLDAYESDLQKSSQSISNRDLEKLLVANARNELDFLEEVGLIFDKKPNGEYDVLHTLGSTYPRLVHYKAMTGIEGSKLMARDCKDHGAKFHQFIFIHKLIRTNGEIAGAIGVDMRSGEFKTFVGKAIVLATGGCGAIYDLTTYPKGITGDGFALAYDAGAEIIDMEFMQFEPCVFVYPEALKGKVIPTTLLRAGAQLRNGRNEDILSKYGLDRAAVQKYSLARAMLGEIRSGNASPHGGVFYDVSMLPRKRVVEDHAIFYRPAFAAGIDLMKDPAEVMPAAHTALGGVRINAHCETSLPGLYAAGEVAGGFYGANRMGGSAGIETLVFGNIAGINAGKHARNIESSDCSAVLESAKIEEAKLKILMHKDTTEITITKLSGIQEEIKKIMVSKVNLLKNRHELEEANERIRELQRELATKKAGNTKDLIRLLECGNMLKVALMIIESSLLRKESRGAFYREDFPETDNSNWKGNIVIRNVAQEMDLRFEPVTEYASKSLLSSELRRT